MEEINIWFSIFIPLLGVIIANRFFKQHFEWWEYLLAPIISFLFTLIFLLILKHSLNSDTEYWGSVALKARYDEYYETYVRKTCTRTVSCGKNCTTTQSYDCSYCDENNPEWYVYDNIGGQYSISKEEYDRLKRIWNNEQFVELNRNINYHFGCGKDGDAYETHWNKDIYTSKCISVEKSYENPTLNAYSAFKYKNLDEKEVKKYGLYDYPSSDYLYQNNLLGVYAKDSVKKLFQFLNGYAGSNKNARYYFLFFNNKPISTAIFQQSYWKNGNQNEIVVCIGIDNQKNIQWVHPFGWNMNKRLFVDLREDIIEIKKLDFNQLYNISLNNLKNYKVTILQKEFSYLEPELPAWSFITVYIINILITIGCIVFGIFYEPKNYYY